MSAPRRPAVGFLLAAALVVAWAVPPALAAESRQYDAQGRLTDVAYQNGSSLHYAYDANGNILSIVTSLATAVDETGSPLQFALGPTTPNPGAGARSIAFSTPSSGRVTLRVFDAAGRLVSTLVDRELPAGRHVARFTGDAWAGGVYYYRLTFGAKARTGRMVVLR